LKKTKREAGSNRPILRNLLEVQGRVPVIGLQKLVVAASERLNLTPKTVNRLPELG
jgi:hypothetical protein